MGSRLALINLMFTSAASGLAICRQTGGELGRAVWGGVLYR